MHREFRPKFSNQKCSKKRQNEGIIKSWKSAASKKKTNQSSNCKNILFLEEYFEVRNCEHILDLKYDTYWNWTDGSFCCLKNLSRVHRSVTFEKYELSQGMAKTRHLFLIWVIPTYEFILNNS